MAYTKTIWENLPSTNTPINATNLNKIENGTEELDITTTSNTEKLSNIGTTTNYSIDKVIPTSVNTNLTSVTLTPGKYLLIGVAQYSTNSSGVRSLFFSNSPTEANRDRFSMTRVPTATGYSLFIQVISAVNVNETKTIYLNAFQNSGSDLTVNSGLSVVNL